ncbi:hypothetical protein H6G41_22845 [Tolypothrix sp. FACHB-123]|uniref:hypothetical protein n=1 Tax=Tolypothrix sp. FACHB-123 TaxID=2692868 RepID=UPI0016858855|nr:hypothetical protein [Tolypothrix sp. FACHB-123]MBD2357421.1 hypothetical protein [Tolypothrix sp. FACHB-123]
MGKFLLVPIHLDALYLKDGTSVAEAMVEFNRLPYFSGKRDVNPDIVNLSESIVSQPFENKNLYLKAGIHLHWALPDALTKQSKDGTFPAVPNRWLITRSKKDGTNAKSWIIESDYLYPPDAGFQEDSITYPYKDTNNSNSPPFRYLGRKLTFDDWKNSGSKNGAGAKYLERLTAVGYGEPTFAAFYPNCRSVFGFHDAELPELTPQSDLKYDVIGWYSEPQQDYLGEFFKNFKTSFNEDFKEDLTPENFIDAIEEEMKWKFLPSSYSDNDQQQESQEKRQQRIIDIKKELEWQETLNQNSCISQIICFSRLTFNTNYNNISLVEKANISLAVANTGTQALSAYLAETIDKSQKSIIEEQLEALQLAETLASQELDTGFKFEELRHEAGFNAVAGGFLWKIQLDTATNQSNLEKTTSPATLELPSELAIQLNELNQKQQEYDYEWAKIISRRRQLFSDWYKYMVSTYPPEDSWDNYPDIDEVKYYIEERGLKPLHDKINEIGTLNLSYDNSDKLSRAVGSDNSESAKLAKQINELISNINAHNEKVKQEYNALPKEKSKNLPHPPTYYLERASSSRFWQPKEPVVLMVGEDVKPTQRHGEDGRLNPDDLLECYLIDIYKDIQDKQSLLSIFDGVISHKLNALNPSKESQGESQNPQERIGFDTWKKQPWNPILLEWLIEIFPVASGSNKTSVNRNYSNDFLTQNYALQTNDVDLSPKPDQSVFDNNIKGSIKTDKHSNIYSGSSILTPYAKSLLQNRIEEYLKNYGNLEKFYKEKGIEQKKRNIEFLEEQIDQIEKWYPTKDFKDPTYTAIKTYKDLKSLNCLSQALGGFNEALLMHKQTLQLIIEDPIGFDDYKTFTNKVAEAVAGEIKSAPQPLDDFSPIRSGEMRIIDLQLIDTFGQVRNLDWSEYVIKPESMKAQEDNRIVLPPRFVQPCRINFRWLSASDKDNQESNDHPATSPICGWILPNNLNGSLMIYDSEGQALGSINTNAEWDYAPGSIQIKTENIQNTHLKKVVNTVMRLGKKFLENFNSCLNNALNNINPENFAQHQSVALLMGRPIAVVRASVNLELQGLPAINQDWNVFRQEMQQMTPLENRDTDDFVNVKIPIRIGEYRQLNDGVIGYWKEQKIENEETYKYENDIFYAQQSDNIESDKIETQYIDPNKNPEVEEGSINILQSINSPPQILTMLVDLRGVFHATSGVLPTKVISIPPEQYAKALANIKVTFLTAPILTEKTNQGRLKLPLPTAPDYDWAWLEKKGREQWSELLTIPVIEKSAFTQAYLEHQANKDPVRAWEVLLEQKWLINEQQTKAEIASKDKRKKLEGVELKGLDNMIEKIFDLHEISIHPVTYRASFSDLQEIREGWLVLKPHEPNQKSNS